MVRKLLCRGGFTSQAGLKVKIFAFIEDFNRTMAKPFTWDLHGQTAHLINAQFIDAVEY
ncbi:MAG TPA: hypothetical protein V6D29_23055 [Leptolyngbyaceae cyanobacterium]